MEWNLREPAHSHSLFAPDVIMMIDILCPFGQPMAFGDAVQHCLGVGVSVGVFLLVVLGSLTMQPQLASCSQSSPCFSL